MTTLVTGATGHLGRLIVDRLLDRVPAAELAVSVRDPGRAAELAAAGVDVRHGDFAEPDTLRTAFAGVDRLVLVSVDGPDEVRVRLHRNAVAAAADAGVGFVAYTSVTEAETNPMPLARVHRDTEHAIAGSGMAYSFLRNTMYHENYTLTLPEAYRQGALVTSTGDGVLASASRADLAEAAAVVASTAGHEGTAYELTGPRAWSFAELAGLAGAVTGRALPYRSIPDADLDAAMRAGGLPPFVAELLVGIYAGIRAGHLAAVRPDLEKLLGRPATPVEDAVRTALS